MISKKLVNILACPVNHKALTLATSEIINKINSKITEKKCYTVTKIQVKSLLKAALYEPSSGLVYRIENDIPILLPEEAIDSQNL